jgi:hypothetical protein
MAQALPGYGKSVANLGVKPELYCTFFVWVSVDLPSRGKRKNELWPNSANHWLISGTISEGPSWESSRHFESGRQQEKVDSLQKAGNS